MAISKIQVGTTSHDIRGIYPVVGTQTTDTSAWTGAIDVKELYEGLTIAYNLPRASASTAVTLNLTLSGGGTTGAIDCYYKTNTRITTHYSSGDTVIMTYWPANKMKVGGTLRTTACWVAQAQYVVGNTIPAAYCGTAAGTAAKTASFSSAAWDTNFVGYCFVDMYYANTYNGALTFNVGSLGAKPIYINGAISSSSNKTLPAGPYLAYCDGAAWYFRTDGQDPQLANLIYSQNNPNNDYNANFISGNTYVVGTGANDYELDQQTNLDAAVEELNWLIGQQDIKTLITDRAATTAPPVINSSTASTLGTGTDYARSNHTHGLTKAAVTTALGYTPPSAAGASVTSSAPVAVGTSAVTGTSTYAARADHVHAITKATVTTALGYTPPTTNSTYTAANAAPPVINSSTASTTGTSANYARQDHTHGLTKAAVTTALGYTPPTTNSTYTAANAAPANVGTAAVTGSSANYARQDHVHAITGATVTSALGYTPPTVTSTAPVAIATTSAVGTSTYAARADHKHNITSATITTALGYTPQRYDRVQTGTLNPSSVTADATTLNNAGCLIYIQTD